MHRNKIGLALDKSFTPSDWDDWIWQKNHIVMDVPTLCKVLEKDESDFGDLSEIMKRFNMSITPHWVALLDENNLDTCPIARQCIPRDIELEKSWSEEEDPLHEESSVTPLSIVHRYPDRLLYLIGNKCSMYCRFCTRKRMVAQDEGAIRKEILKKGMDYIREHTEIRDVLLSGGDPLFMSTSLLDSIITELRGIEHVEFIRIGSRIPCVMPQRIDDKLCEMLSKHSPIWINVHFDNSKEINEDVANGLERLRKAGCPLNNQSVFLKGVNDSKEEMTKLCHKLLTVGVRPYYLYQGDLVVGTSHLRVSVSKGLEIVKSMVGNTTGLARPTFVVDAPHGGGKVPVNPNYVKMLGKDKILLENYEGRTILYDDE